VVLLVDSVEHEDLLVDYAHQGSDSIAVELVGRSEREFLELTFDLVIEL